MACGLKIQTRREYKIFERGDRFSAAMLETPALKSLAPKSCFHFAHKFRDTCHKILENVSTQYPRHQAGLFSLNYSGEFRATILKKNH